MTITIYRGNQIGGCITQIESANGSKILIDFGSNLPGSTTSDWTDEQICEITQGVNAIFYTHYHGDHLGSIHRVPASIPQYMGEGAKAVSLIKTRVLATKKEDAKKQLKMLEKANTFQERDEICIPSKEKYDIKVTPYFVSHSAFDAYMFLIECDKKRILHTGDFRGHGYLSKGLWKTLRKYIHQVDILITEGTMLSRGKEEVEHESTLAKRAAKMLRTPSGKNKYFFALCSSTDIDRLATFHKACKETGAAFICDKYQKQVLEEFTQRAGAKSDLYDFSDAFEWKRCDFKTQLNNGFILPVRANKYQLDAIRRLRHYFPHAELIYSMWDGYYKGTKEQINSDVVTMREAFKEHVYNLHTSGHATGKDLAKVCTLVQPRIAIIPIHSESNSNYKQLNIPQELKDRVYTESAEVEGIKIQINN